MKRGEVWLVGLDPTLGQEQKGPRPALIVSPEAFNRFKKAPVVVPITSRGNFARTAGFAVKLDDAGTKTTGIIRCDQPRALDLNARGGKKLRMSRTKSWMRRSQSWRLFSNSVRSARPYISLGCSRASFSFVTNAREV
jgi:mRNA-degrading endonuclease toxin of MazEF toxin-antitoxin module